MKTEIKNNGKSGAEFNHQLFINARLYAEAAQLSVISAIRDTVRRDFNQHGYAAFQGFEVAA